MRPAPQWQKPGDPVEGIWKEELLRYLGTTFNLQVLIETGTCEGSTIYAVHDAFREIHSVELSPYYFAKARTRLQHIQNINLYLGNSGIWINRILHDISNEPTLFWLDAHPSGGLTANEGDPLGEELKAIMSKRPDALIVIDDMSDASLVHLNLDFTGWHKEYRTGEVFMHKGGYEIPPFEE
jgi:hypothetical protein